MSDGITDMEIEREKETEHTAEHCMVYSCSDCLLGAQIRLKADYFIGYYCTKTGNVLKSEDIIEQRVADKCPIPDRGEYTIKLERYIP